MSPNRHWIIIVGGAICIILTILGVISYPADNQGILEIIGYSIGIPLGILGILLLVYFRGLPEQPKFSKSSE